jgi:hypothetical protein
LALFFTYQQICETSFSYAKQSFHVIQVFAVCCSNQEEKNKKSESTYC